MSFSDVIRNDASLDFFYDYLSFVFVFCDRGISKLGLYSSAQDMLLEFIAAKQAYVQSSSATVL